MATILPPPNQTVFQQQTKTSAEQSWKMWEKSSKQEMTPGIASYVSLHASLRADFK